MKIRFRENRMDTGDSAGVGENTDRPYGLLNRALGLICQPVFLVSVSLGNLLAR
jgi:hypothetical protein